MDITLKELEKFVKDSIDKEDIMLTVIIADGLITLRLWFTELNISASETFYADIDKKEVKNILRNLLRQINSLLN